MIFSAPALWCRRAMAIPLVSVSVSASTGKMLGQMIKSRNFSLSVFFLCILTLLIILIKPLTTKAYDRCISDDCGTSVIKRRKCFNCYQTCHICHCKWLFYTTGCMKSTGIITKWFMSHFPLQMPVLHNWLYEVYRNYNQVPFHNFKHCFMVAQMVSHSKYIYNVQWWFVNPGSDSPEISLVRTKSAGTDFCSTSNRGPWAKSH